VQPQRQTHEIINQQIQLVAKADKQIQSLKPRYLLSMHASTFNFLELTHLYWFRHFRVSITCKQDEF